MYTREYREHTEPEIADFYEISRECSFRKEYSMLKGWKLALKLGVRNIFCQIIIKDYPFLLP